MLAAGASFVVMSSVVRSLSADVHPIEIAFFRALVGLLLMLPYLIRTRGRGLRTDSQKFYIARGLIGTIFITTYFPGLALIAVADAQALVFTAPLFVAVFAILILGETPHLRRIAALVTGFAGILLILRPGFEEIGLGAILVLISALANAASNLIAKFKTRSDHPDTVVLYLGIYVTPVVLVPALFVWTWPGWIDLGWLFAVGALATMNQRFLSRAFAVADATAVLPYDFVRLPFAALVGFMAFGEMPDAYVWIGGAVIFVASVVIAHREAQADRRKIS